jgi:hypothetical protein
MFVVQISGILYIITRMPSMLHSPPALHTRTSAGTHALPQAGTEHEMISPTAIALSAAVWGAALLVAFYLPVLGIRWRTPWPVHALGVLSLLTAATAVTGLILGVPFY